MRVRAAILVVILGAALTGCGGGGGNKTPSANSTRLGTPSGQATEIKLDCTKYADTAQKIVQAQQALFAGGGGTTAALNALKAQLDGLKDGAPDNVKAAVDELKTAFDKVEEAIQNPGSDAQSTLASMGTQLSKDGQTITTYIVSQCQR